MSMSLSTSKFTRGRSAVKKEMSMQSWYDSDYGFHYSFVSVL